MRHFSKEAYRFWVDIHFSNRHLLATAEAFERHLAWISVRQLTDLICGTFRLYRHD